ncbi:TPA: DUF551 domain-containing protein [Enterobacter roggenkampii]
MAEFTKEQLIEEVHYNLEHCFCSEKTKRLMEIALAALTAPQLPQPAVLSVPDGVLKSLLPDAEKPDFWFEHNGKIFFEGVKFNNAVFEACRAAMLQGADRKPELTVWYGSMPESNGKANWTAILHRKGEGRCMDGFTIDRSEYPGRVLYAADRVRYLIGEKSERPSILDYDADAHSGYVRPGNYPVIPDGLRLALSNAGIAAPESDEMLAATCEKHIQALVTWVKERQPFKSAVIPDGWVACSERMPETMVSVLVTGTWFHHAVAFWDGLSWCDLDFEPPVTHWMPLPAAPQQEAK